LVAIHRRLQSDTRHRADVSEGAARLDAIVQSAMNAIITVDAGQCIVVFNAAAEQMFGCSAAQALGSPLERFIPERFRAVHRAHLERFGRTGETARRMGLETALWALRADGSEFPIEASISQATVGGEKLLSVILRDITERVRAESELLRSQQQTRASEQRLEAIVRSAMDAIVTVDASQRIVLFNAAAEQMFGCAAAEAVGGPLDRFIPERFAPSTAGTSSSSVAPATRRAAWVRESRCRPCARTAPSSRSKPRSRRWRSATSSSSP
jgi:PAS domain S-box-containing protein